MSEDPRKWVILELCFLSTWCHVYTSLSCDNHFLCSQIGYSTLLRCKLYFIPFVTNLRNPQKTILQPTDMVHIVMDSSRDFPTLPTPKIYPFFLSPKETPPPWSSLSERNFFCISSYMFGSSTIHLQILTAPPLTHLQQESLIRLRNPFQFEFPEGR